MIPVAKLNAIVNRGLFHPLKAIVDRVNSGLCTAWGAEGGLLLCMRSVPVSPKLSINDFILHPPNHRGAHPLKRKAVNLLRVLAVSANLREGL